MSSSSHRILSLVMFVGIGMAALITTAAVASAPSITIEKAVHFVTPSGEDVLVQPGTYEVEAVEKGLRLRPKDGKPEDAKLIQAQAIANDAKLTAPEVMLGPGAGDADRLHVMLFLPDGQGFDAVGSFSGVQTRATTTRIPLYRLWKSYFAFGGHDLFTTSLDEVASAVMIGYQNIGIYSYVPNVGTPLYRLYHRVKDRHFYTTSISELPGLIGLGYAIEGICCYVLSSPGEGTSPLYRYQDQGMGYHYWTLSQNQAKENWTYEGECCYVYTSPEAVSAPPPPPPPPPTTLAPMRPLFPLLPPSAISPPAPVPPPPPDQQLFAPPSGYTLQETLTVPLTGATVTSQATLKSGVTYKVRAAGTATAGSGILTDPEYAWTSSITVDYCNNSPSDVDLGLGLNDPSTARGYRKQPFWGAYAASHEYTIDVVGQNQPLRLNYHDCNYSDNAGTLTVAIFAPATPPSAATMPAPPPSPPAPASPTSPQPPGPPPPGMAGAPPSPRQPIVVDNRAPTVLRTGQWCVSNVKGDYGKDSEHSCRGGAHSFRWTPTLPQAGTYDVFIWWPNHQNRSTMVPFTVHHAGGDTVKTFNQQTGGKQWVLHGRYGFAAGTGSYVEVTDRNGPAGADAVQFVPVP